MATTRIPYTAETVRLSDVPTEPLTLPRAPASFTGLLLLVACLLILGACWLVVRVGDQAFAVGAAALVAGFIWLAFGREG